MYDGDFAQSKAMKCIAVALLLANAVGVYAVHYKMDTPPRMALGDDDVMQPVVALNHYDGPLPSWADASTPPAVNAPEPENVSAPELPAIAVKQDVKTKDATPPHAGAENMAVAAHSVAAASLTPPVGISPSRVRVAFKTSPERISSSPVKIAAVKPKSQSKHLAAPPAVALAEISTKHRAAAHSSVSKSVAVSHPNPSIDVAPDAVLVIPHTDLVLHYSNLAVPSSDSGQAPSPQLQAVAPEQAGANELPAVSDASRTAEVGATAAPVAPDAASVGSTNSPQSDLSAGVRS
jgi:hypothetical protein